MNRKVDLESRSNKTKRYSGEPTLYRADEAATKTGKTQSNIHYKIYAVNKPPKNNIQRTKKIISLKSITKTI